MIIEVWEWAVVFRLEPIFIIWKIKGGYKSLKKILSSIFKLGDS